MNDHIRAALLEGLNPEQARAVSSDRPRMLTIAGAGTGKTHVLARRVVRLIAAGVPPELILCVTFTRKAAAEMQERIARYLATHWTRPPEVPDVSTLHAWGARLIRRYPESFGLTRDFSIYDEHDREDVIRAVAHERGFKNAPTARLPTLWREDKIRRAYTERLLEGNAIDFDMIEGFTLRLLTELPASRTEWTGRYRHVLVDEYQDTNLAQVAIVRNVAPQNLFIVGDPRQSIYRFRGAESATIVEHARDADFEVVELVRNYRSVTEVVDVGNGCVDGDWSPMVSVRGPAASAPAVTAHTFRSEPPMVAGLLRELLAQGYRPGDVAVLGRTWAAVDAVHEQLRAAGVPVNYCGNEDDPWASDDGRALARCIQLAANPLDDNLAGFVAEWGALGARRFPDGIQATRSRARVGRRRLLDQLAAESSAWARVLELLRMHRVSPWTAAEHARAFLAGLEILETYTGRALVSRVERINGLLKELDTKAITCERFVEWWSSRSAVERIDETRDAVHLMTVHAAKGLEWPVVIGIDVRAGVYPSARVSATEDDRHEDLRVFYVLATRARDRLLLTRPTVYQPPYGGAKMMTAPCPFLERPGAPSETPWAPGRWGGALPPGW